MIIMKILNFGSLNIDYVYDVNHFMKPGETQASNHLGIFCGGKGLNQSVALSRNGVEVYHAGAVGETDSQMLLNTLSDAGVHLDYIKKVGGPSGHAIIQKDPLGQNSILLFGGANQKIENEVVVEVLSHFEAGDYLILQNEISCMPEIMRQAHEKGMIIVLNPSPMHPDVLKFPLELVDYFLLNEIEAQDICGINEEGEVLIKRMADLFPKAQIVLTLGMKGVQYQFKNINLSHDIFDVKVVDTTGAGDTFTGFFIGSIVKGRGVEEALDLASRAAAISVSRSGAAASIPDLVEVLNWHLP